PLIELHTRQVEQRLHVLRVDLVRAHEGTLRAFEVAGLPGREAEHVVAPRVVRVLVDVRGEERGGIRITLLLIDLLAFGDRDRLARTTRPETRHGCATLYVS